MVEKRSFFTPNYNHVEIIFEIIFVKIPGSHPSPSWANFKKKKTFEKNAAFCSKGGQLRFRVRQGQRAAEGDGGAQGQHHEDVGRPFPPLLPRGR
jgi:hypothetical protein